MRIDQVITDVRALLAAFPELAEDEELRLDCLTGETSIQEAVTYLLGEINSTNELTTGIGARLQTLRARKDRLERRDEMLRSLAFKLMEAADIRKLELPDATLSIRKGTPKVIIVDEAALPDEVCEFKRVPDKARIKSWIEAGNTVEGATMSNGEATLSIRRG